MMKVIYKFRIEAEKAQFHDTHAVAKILWPKGSVALSIQEQDRRLTLWAECPVDATENETLLLAVIPTGQPVSIPESWQHGATVQLWNGTVWHIYRI